MPSSRWSATSTLHDTSAAQQDLLTQLFRSGAGAIAGKIGCSYMSSERRGTVAACNNTKKSFLDTHHNAAADSNVEAVNAITHLLRRASTNDTPRRTLVRHRSKPDTMNKPTPAITPEEYDRLPNSIQYVTLRASQALANTFRRKYFSSEERLQIAQRSAVEKRQRQPSKKSDTSTPSQPVSSCECSKRRKTVKKIDTKKQRRSSLPLVFVAEAAQGEAAWFDSLPEKVKRSQFDERERTAFSRTAPPERPHTSSSHKPVFDHFGWDKNRSASAETPRMPSSPCTTPSLHSPSLSVATSRSHESRSSTRTRQTLPPALVMPKSRTPEQERLATRRNFLLHPIPLPPPVLAPVATLPSPDTSEYIQSKQLGSIVVRLEQSMSDDDTTPTQELGIAQGKLKNLPPAWYDEKLDFGFDIRKPSTSTLDSWDNPRTLSPSVSDTASSQGPMTPISPALHSFDVKAEHHTSLQQIMERDNQVTNFSHLQAQRSYEVLKPRRNGAKHLVDGFYEGHDPDKPYSVTVQYGNNDPLALETLPVCDDMTGAHGAFAMQPENNASGFRKVLKVIRGH